MQINTQIFKSVKANASAGRAILTIAAIVSGIATGKMMYLGSENDPWIIRWAKVALGLGLVEGGLAFTYHGIRKVFTNGIQRAVAWTFLFALVGAVLCNLFTERMLARGIPLVPFQQAWVDWAFDGVVVVVMLAIGAIQLFSDEQRLERHALKVLGEEAEEKLRKARGEFPHQIDAEARETGQLSAGKDRPRW